jgi:hypothetical protein
MILMLTCILLQVAMERTDRTDRTDTTTPITDIMTMFTYREFNLIYPYRKNVP